MDWKLELDALIQCTMTFAKDVKPEPISEISPVIRAAEQTLADTSTPIPRPTGSAPKLRQTSERDEIQTRVTNFRAHQQKIGREREDYYLQTKAKMLAVRRSPPG